ncbi:acyl-CoA dehydrogenase [Actinomadura sp. LD22]|uniref:Acyl-CoA dehydrogenase n=1 Tax=Actinomadura physcomitrii TaxID=2650748 RepID=A0A6I4MD09_9ACTN|nr:acyl-CoA dehydrogenase family protein [Actinomadura physcomitrii]MWA03602.1 acyl-CoA dehydrogenase [Actinomadura physcomitrii]
MNLAPSDLQNELAAAARQWLARELPVARSRDLAAGHGELPDAGTWTRCAELGWLGLGLPDACGGLGLGAAEEVMVFRELGRGLAPGPFLASVLGARAAATAGRADIAAAIADGSRRVALSLSGRVLDGRAGDLLLTLDENGAVLDEIVEDAPLASVDPLTRVSSLVRATPLLRVEDALLLSRGHVLAAAQLLGIIEAVRDMSVAYAGSRTQFGRPIGSFQAVKHRCADMAVSAYAVVGQVGQAALYVDARRPAAAFQAAAAYVVAARGAVRSATDNIQNHGGIGFSWEHDAHLYLKRATVLAAAFGPLRQAHRPLMAPSRHEFE